MAATDSTAKKRDRSAYNRERYIKQKDTVTEEEKQKKRAYLKAWHEANKARMKVERAAYFKAYNAANREKQKAWRDANADALRAYASAYYVQNKEQMSAQARENYLANADAYKERARKWEAENKARKLELQRTRYRKDLEKSRQKSRLDWLKNAEKHNARKREYRRERPDLALHHCRLRQTRKQKATPPWADLKAIKAVYAEASRRKKQTGEAWHVDHVIPLKHPLVCGLHVHTNLQVIPGKENQRKHNVFVV
jgi:hypothetical protein